MSDDGKEPDDPMIAILEEGIKKVLASSKSKAPDIIRAVEAGVKLQLMKHKTSGGTSDEHYFG